MKPQSSVFAMSLADARPLTLLQPPLLQFGVGCSEPAAAWFAQQGCRHVLIVSSPSVSSAADALGAGLGGVGISVRHWRGVPAEPDVAALEAARIHVAGTPLDGVLGVGGGSVLDVAKLVAALHGRAEPVGTYFGSGLVPLRRTRLACLPTTAGAGSEVSPNAILYDPADRLKKAVISPQLVADAAFVDPALTVSAPPALTAATGLDALVHCLEAYANRFAHPIVDRYALEGIRLIAGHLERAVRQGDDLEARSAVALGALYGGLCLGPVNTAAVHALAYPLGSEFRLPHGVSNALLLPHVVRFNLPAAPERYAAIARALGVTSAGTPAEVATLGVERLEALSDACGIPRRLADLGITASAIPGLAAAAMKVTRLLKNNPRELSVADAEHLYRQAL